MISNYIWDRQHTDPAADPLMGIPTLAGLITFGCNIPIFSLEFETATPIDFPGETLSADTRAAARWLNFVDRDDILGWPMKALFEAELTTPGTLTPAQVETVNRIEDHEINVGNIATSWNPAAHGAYWTDDDFSRPVAEYIKAILKSLDE